MGRPLTFRQQYKQEYRIYRNMQARCGYGAKTNLDNPRNDTYLGLRICDRWLEAFENFMEDMGPMPGPEYSLDRKRVEDRYHKDNCQWLIWNDNRNKSRRNQVLTH